MFLHHRHGDNQHQLVPSVRKETYKEAIKGKFLNSTTLQYCTVRRSLQGSLRCSRLVTVHHLYTSVHLLDCPTVLYGTVRYLFTFCDMNL